VSRVDALRMFTLEGNARFLEILQTQDSDTILQVTNLSMNKSMTTLLSSKIDTSFEVPTTRRSVGANLWHLLGTGADLEEQQDNPLLWNWMAARLMGLLLREGDRITEVAAWSCVDDAQRYYRHYLAGPFSIYRMHYNEIAICDAVLCTPIERPGEVVAQLAGTLALISSPMVMRLATRMYYNPKSESIIEGAAGKGAGSSRRLASYLNQVGRTVSFYDSGLKGFIDQMPAEFNKYLRN